MVDKGCFLKLAHLLKTGVHGIVSQKGNLAGLQRHGVVI
jgi:hypothetical protein